MRTAREILKRCKCSYCPVYGRLQHNGLSRIITGIFKKTSKYEKVLISLSSNLHFVVEVKVKNKKVSKIKPYGLIVI